MYEGLPSVCYNKLPSTGEIILIKKGETGYYKCDIPKESSIDVLNERIGVTKAQAEAMFMGSLFGWHVEGANPNNYDENGLPKRKA